MAKYIKREDMSSAISELLESPYANHDSFFCAGIRDCLKLVKDMVDDKVSKSLKIPNADVRENVPGEWIPDDDNDYYELWKCSVCGNCIFDHRYDFCQNCGADMRPRDNE